VTPILSTPSQYCNEADIGILDHPFPGRLGVRNMQIILIRVGTMFTVSKPCHSCCFLSRARPSHRVCDVVPQHAGTRVHHI